MVWDVPNSLRPQPVFFMTGISSCKFRSWKHPGKYSFNIYCQFGVVRHVHVVGSPERQIIVLVLIVEGKTWKENKYELIWKIIRLYTSNKFICYQNCMWKKVRFSGNEIFIELRRAEKGLCNILSDKYKIFITFLIFKLHFLR